MAGLVPAIHAFGAEPKSKTWMPGTSPGMTRWDRATAHSARRANHFVAFDDPCPALFSKIFWFSETANHFYIRAVLSSRRGALAIVTNVGTGCGGRGGAFDE
jgi:hypothetical protein